MVSLAQLWAESGDAALGDALSVTSLDLDDCGVVREVCACVARRVLTAAAAAAAATAEKEEEAGRLAV